MNDKNTNENKEVKDVENDKKINNKNISNYNKNYIILSVCSFLFLILIIIAFVSKKDKHIKKNKKIKKQIHSNYYKNKAEANKYFEQNRDYGALKYGQECIKAEPNNPNGYFVIIKALIQVKEYYEASKYLEKAKKLCIKERDTEVYLKLENIINSNIAKLKELKDKNIDVNNITPFLKKIITDGAQINKNQIDYNSNNIRGIIATDDINDNEILIKIPRKLLITGEDASNFLSQKYAKNDNVKPEDIKNIINKCYSPNNFSIALFLLENMNNEQYKDYIDIIKSNNYDSFPLKYSEEELKKYENTDIIYMVGIEKIKDYADIKNLRQIKSLSKYTDEQLLDMFLGVSSRTFYHNIHGKRNLFLCPYIDMGNHGNSCNTKWYYDDNTDCFYLESTTKIEKGNEIFDTYGVTLYNKNLLINYGFTDIDNKNQSILLNFDNYMYNCKYLDNNDKNETTALLKDIEEYIKKGGGNNNSKNGKNNKKNKKINISNDKLELMKLETFNKLCLDRLKKYKTTLEQDLKKLEDKNITFNEYNLTNINKDEKLILNYFIDFSNNCIKFLKKNSIRNIKKKIDKEKNISVVSKNYLIELYNKYYSNKK